MRLGIMDVPREAGTSVAHVQLAEALGFSGAGLIDSQSVYRELYVTAAPCGQATRRIRLGPTVTNPITRHPAVTAAAIATLDEATDGRAFLGMGPGDSAVLNLGEKPARLADLRAYIEAVRALLNGEEVEYRGTRVHTRWAKRPVPIFGTAGGPRTLELAGEIADGVIMHLGLFPEIIRESVARVHAGAARAGRDPAAIEVWVLAPIRVTEDVTATVAAERSGLAGRAHFVFGSTFEGKHVPPEFAPAIRRIVAEYQPATHMRRDSPNAAPVEDPTLVRYLAERFDIIGPPEVCIERLRAIEAAGVRNVLTGIATPDPIRSLRDLGERVLPHVA
jgi:5,10-methylenetetrahydromethanopterin reductase